MTEAPALEADRLYRFFHTGGEEILALQGVSLRAESGEVVAVTGPSGSGKSTLLACLAGLDEPDGGTVRVAGEVITRRPEAARARVRASHVGMLFQAGNLLEHLTVDQNVSLAQQLARKPDGARRRHLFDSLGLSARTDAFPSQLSGGEAVRAGLAVALANEPTVLLADEPTGEVDRSTEGRLLGLLRHTAESGAAVVVVTHSDAVAEAADRVVALADGRVVA